MASELIRKAKVPTLAGADAATISGACDQCGDPLAGLRVVRRPVGATMRAFCCNGCAFIAEQLFLAQAGSRDRALLNASIAAEAEASSAAFEAATAAGSHLQLSIRGMVCSACALMIEQSVRRVPGVAKASVDFATHTAYIAFDPKQVTRGELQRAIERAGYDAFAAHVCRSARRHQLGNRATAVRRELRAHLAGIALFGAAALSRGVESTSNVAHGGYRPRAADGDGY